MFIRMELIKEYEDMEKGDTIVVRARTADKLINKGIAKEIGEV